MPRGALMGALSDPIIAGDDNPITLLAKLTNPILILGVGRELILEVGETMFRLHHLVEGAGVADGKAVIEEKPHAASFCSNSTASSISASGTSYQRETP